MLDSTPPAADAPSESRKARLERTDRHNRHDVAGPARHRRSDAAAPANNRTDAKSANDTTQQTKPTNAPDLEAQQNTADSTLADKPAEAAEPQNPAVDTTTIPDTVFSIATAAVNPSNPAAFDSTPGVANAKAALQAAPAAPDPVAAASPEAALNAAAGTPVAAAPAETPPASTAAAATSAASDNAAGTLHADNQGTERQAAVAAPATAPTSPNTATPNTNKPVALQPIGQPTAPDDVAKPAQEHATPARAEAVTQGGAASDPRTPITPIESGEEGKSRDKGENASSNSRHAIGERPAKSDLDAPAQRQFDAAIAVKSGSEAMQNLGALSPATQANAAIATVNAGVIAATPATAVQIPGLAIEIATQAHAGNHRFEIRLDPPELGRIDVRLDIDRDGNVTSRLVVDRADTLDLLKRDASQLERALQQAGLKTSDNALEFSLRQQGFARDEAASQNSAQLIVPDEDMAPLEALRQGYGRLLGLGGGLNITV